MPLADIGVNLTDKRFVADLDKVMTRARTADVRLQIVTGTSIPSSQAASELARAWPDLYATAGVHPHQARDFTTDALRELADLAQETKVCAIGETGLDFNRDFSPRPAQENAFAHQLALAARLKLPVFLHQRDAHSRFLPVLKEHRDSLPAVVVHCFTGERSELFDYLDLDCHIGITGWVCDERRGQPLQALVPNIPLERLLAETDSPYLLPRNRTEKPPVSGRNEPSLLPWIIRQLAGCYGLPEHIIAEHTWNNTLRVFDLTPLPTGLHAETPGDPAN